MKKIKLFENFSKDDSKSLVDFFEGEGFNVALFEQDNMQCAELEKWTDGGVDMLIILMPFSKDKFIDYVDNFDIDEEIDVHRQDPNYKKDFKITESVKDFTDFHNSLKTVVDKLKK